MTEEEIENKALTNFKINFCSTCEDKETCDVSILNCIFYDTIYLDAYKDGYKQGQKDKLIEKEKLVGTFINVDLLKENEELKSTISKMESVTEKNSEVEKVKKEHEKLLEYVNEQKKYSTCIRCTRADVLELEELKSKLKNRNCVDCSNHGANIEVIKLKAQIEKMKCCQNCKHNKNKLEDNEVCWNCERSCAKFSEEIVKDEWEMAE